MVRYYNARLPCRAHSRGNACPAGAERRHRSRSAHELDPRALGFAVLPSSYAAPIAAIAAYSATDWTASAGIRSCRSGPRAGMQRDRVGPGSLRSRDDGLHRSELREHIVAVEDGSYVVSDLAAHGVSTLFPLRTTAMSKLAAMIGQMAVDGRAVVFATRVVRSDAHVIGIDR
jgi:hypothetical protein